LTDNLFKDLRKKSSFYGSNLLDHINQDSSDGNLLGWVNIDRSSMIEFDKLVKAMFNIAKLKRQDNYVQLNEKLVLENVDTNDHVKFSLYLRRNLKDYPFLTYNDTDTNNDLLDILSKFL